MIHGRQAEQRLDGVDHVHCGVEAAIDIGMLRRCWRVFADRECDGTVRIHVVGAVLCVVFDDENRGIVPVRTARNRFDHSPDGEVIIRNRRCRARLAGAGTDGVIVRQIKQHQLREFTAAALCASAHKAIEFVQEFVGSKLIGIIKFEIGEIRVVMIPQQDFSRLSGFDQRHRPWPRTLRAMRVAHVRRKRITFMHDGSRAFSGLRWRRSFLWGIHVFRQQFAPDGFDELSVITIADALVRSVVPKIPGRGIVHVWFVQIERVLVSDLALVVVGAFLAAVGDLPCLFVVIAGDGGSRPLVAVARHFTAVIEVVEDSKLQRQLVQVGRHVRSIHGQRTIAIAHWQVA